MNVKEILTEWLQACKYDGLCNVECGRDDICGCDFENLMHCEGDITNCIPCTFGKDDEVYPLKPRDIKIIDTKEGERK